MGGGYRVRGEGRHTVASCRSRHPRGATLRGRRDVALAVTVSRNGRAVPLGARAGGAQHARGGAEEGSLHLVALCVLPSNSRLR